MKFFRFKFFRFGATDMSPERVRTIRKAKLVLKWLLGTFFALSGAYHFSRLGFDPQLNMLGMPWSQVLIYVSGAFELTLGIMLFFRPSQTMAAWGLIVVLIVVSAAHISNAIDSWAGWELDMGSLETLARIPLQIFLIAWTFWYTRPSRKVLPANAPTPGKSNAPHAAAAAPAVTTTSNTREKQRRVKERRDKERRNRERRDRS
jgi:uncharacterized membrane protein